MSEQMIKLLVRDGVIWKAHEIGQGWRIFWSSDWVNWHELIRAGLLEWEWPNNNYESPLTPTAKFLSEAQTMTVAEGMVIQQQLEVQP